MFWYFDPRYLLFVGPALLLGLIAQLMVSNAYGRYSRVRNARGVTGAEAAQHLLIYNDLGSVRLEGTPGQLTDHYDPRTDTLRLSAPVARTPSVAALGIVAHEVGHAQQVHSGYAPMRLRAALVPVASIGSTAGPWLVLIGVLLRFGGLAWAGILLFSTAALFYLVTLRWSWMPAGAGSICSAKAALWSRKKLRGHRRSCGQRLGPMWPRY
jgi:Zn-dependent membrane protease YugP